MTQIVDRPHPQPLSQLGRGEKNVDRENLKIGIIYLRAIAKYLLYILNESKFE
ncbi:hypothetical protein [Hydrococcus rivularis]|uniref:hypothetical protein n=1 Tax=Hydrococcus rivularis TaxID=1616834 RepID=UPI000A6C3DAE|nr:hypothetical protein [Hydrococcus rivularis]